MDLRELTSSVAEGQDLTVEQAGASADLLASPEVEAEQKAAFLVALAEKGEVAAEVAGLARRFRELARDPGLEKWRERAIDVCGTGGDKIGSFNISTTAAFVLAALGVPVLKHGNRSITSKCGSANLLEALGVHVTADNATLAKSMKELGFCFMFAPAFHPAFKEIMPVRQELAARGQRTVFNILGPLINPSRPAHQLLGVYAPDIVEMLADTLQALGSEAGLVVHSVLGPDRGMDELTVVGQNRVRGFGSLSDMNGSWEPDRFSLRRAPLEDLTGGELEDNLRTLDELLAGKAPKGLEDTIALNVAAALRIVGKYPKIEDGIEAARDAIVGGSLKAKLADTKEFYAAL